MKIKLAEQQGEQKNQVILGRSKENFSGNVSDQEAYRQIADRADKNKAVTVFAGKDKTVIYQLLLNEEKPVYSDLEHARRSAYSLFKTLDDQDMQSFEIINAGLEKEVFLAFVEGLALTNYRFDKYFTSSDQSFAIEEAFLFDNQCSEKDILNLTSVLEGTYFARDLVNEPLSYLTAEKLAEEISGKGAESGFSVEVFNKKKIEALRMGGLLAVNKGSIDPPTFSILQWKPENAVNKKPIILVGKGIVYDTGGLSLKPTHNSMDYMKCDMGGAAAVAGTFLSIALGELPLYVIGLVPATDNRPDGNAYVPGDVIQMHNGSTVEVLNTDAEGRMILADALSYASQYDPELVIELSTLTGSAHAALGNYAIAGMGNAGEKDMSALKDSGIKTHERIAEFPFWDDYAELLKSDIADMKNIGGKYAGAITAGKFLEKFTSYPFIHLDIAGPSFNKSRDNYRGTGGSGVGVRLLYDFISGKQNQK